MSKSNPTVFMSYSYDSESHQDWVLNLATDLKENGINSRLDRWHLAPGEEIPHFMEKEISSADFIVVVCTPQYASRSNDRCGGVGYEQQIISGEIFTGTKRRKFVPIVRQGDATAHQSSYLPSHFIGTKYIDFRHDSSYRESLDELMRHIFGVPKYIEPALGVSPYANRFSEDTSLVLKSPSKDLPATISEFPKAISYGDRVRHPVYGTGDVVDIVYLDESKYLIRVRKSDGVLTDSSPGELEVLYSRPGWTAPPRKTIRTRLSERPYM